MTTRNRRRGGTNWDDVVIWVGLIIIVVGLCFVYVGEVQKDQNEHNLAIEKEKTKQLELQLKLKAEDTPSQQTKGYEYKGPKVRPLPPEVEPEEDDPAEGEE